MRKIAIPALLALLIAAFPLASLAKDYGEGVGAGKPEKVSTILESPNKYVGKRVVVEGIIVDVCKVRGCWVELSGDKPGQKLKVKVTDGEIVFPLEVRGKKAYVSGTLIEMKLTKEEALRQAKHYAEESGKDFNPNNVKEGTVYMLKATGASIP